VAGALLGDPQAVRAGVTDGGYDVLNAAGQRHRGRMLIHGQVPRQAGVVPSRVAGCE